MVTSVFQNIAAAANDARVEDARRWYRDQASKVKRVNAARLIDPKNVKTNLAKYNIGQMFMFFYDPKGKAVLPYYDRFPLIFILDIYPDGFLGLNLHYLPRNYRAKLMDALYQTLNNNKMNGTTRIKVTYDLLKNVASMRYYKPCLKRYLAGHVKQRFIYIEPQNWDKALMLPTERFMKKPTAFVHRESVQMIQRIN